MYVLIHFAVLCLGGSVLLSEFSSDTRWRQPCQQDSLKTLLLARGVGPHRQTEPLEISTPLFGQLSFSHLSSIIWESQRESEKQMINDVLTRRWSIMPAAVEGRNNSSLFFEASFREAWLSPSAPLSLLPSPTLQQPTPIVTTVCFAKGIYICVSSFNYPLPQLVTKFSHHNITL